MFCVYVKIIMLLMWQKIVKEKIDVKKLPNADEYPWSLFNIEEIGDD